MMSRITEASGREVNDYMKIAMKNKNDLLSHHNLFTKTLLTVENIISDGYCGYYCC